MEDTAIPSPPPEASVWIVSARHQTAFTRSCQDVPLPPPPPTLTAPDQRLVLAIYSFDADPGAEDTITITDGETLVVVEEEPNGWTKVRRRHGVEEGFVPTSYLQDA